MGNQGLERNAKPTKATSKVGRQKVTAEETQKALHTLSNKELIPYLKGHHLLKNCAKAKPDKLPSKGEMVWARNYGSVYWPAFVADMVDLEAKVDGADDIDDSAYTFVMFLEESFRFAPIPWGQIIPFQEHEIQKLLIPKFNKLVVKRSWKPSTMYKRSFELINEFCNMPPPDRQKSAESRFKIEREIVLKKRDAATPKKSTNKATDEPPIDNEINKVVSLSRNKKKSGLRVSDRIVRKQIGKIKQKNTAKKKTEKQSEKKTPVKTVKPNKNARPEVGGEVLRNWTKDRFDRIPKHYAFESSNPVICQQCNTDIRENEEVKLCHGLPHHGKCLNKQDNLLKCSMCIEQLCFLCKKPSDESKVAFKCSRCDLRFHIDCLFNEWPQAEIQGSNGPIICPVHFCHTCLGEQKIFSRFRDYTANPSRAYKCLLCLSTYHKSCLPAGCGEDIQGKEFIICPKHRIPDLKVQQRRIGCLACYKALKPKEDRVECSYCIQALHPACVGYTGDICEKVPLEVFGKGYKCYSCRWGLFPVYGQVVWYQQPQSQYWPSRILYPNECKRRSTGGAKRLPGQYSVEYFGGTSFYDNASRAIPLHLTTIEIFKSMKVYQDTPKILRAHEEAAFFLQFGEKYRDTILTNPKPVYKKIERNVYRTITAQKVKEPSDICSCSEDVKSTTVCLADSGCTNRDMEMECSDRICKGGKRCSNRMFTERKNDDEFLEQRLFSNKGWGVVAKKQFNPGDFVSEYRGEVIDRNEMVWRLNRKEEEDPMYILEISKEFFIDAEYIGNLSRLINHSCDPNSEVRKYLSQGRSVGGIFAKRLIAVNEEVTFDYGCGSQSTAPFRCRCGSGKCLVFVGKEVPEGFQLEEDPDTNIDKWDDVCSKCGFGGRVICCEHIGCGKVWHYQCIGLSRPPRKNWCCPEHPTTSKGKKKVLGYSKTKTKTSVKSGKPKPLKTEEITQVDGNATVPKKKSHKLSIPSASAQQNLPFPTTPTSTKPRDRVVNSRSVSQKRKSPEDNSTPTTPTQSKKLKTSSSEEEIISVVPNAISSSKRQLRSSKASDSMETVNASLVEKQEHTSDKEDDVEITFIGASGESSTQEECPSNKIVSTPLTRSTHKRRINGTYKSCESSPLSIDDDREGIASTSTTSSPLLEMIVKPENPIATLDMKITMSTPTNNNRRNARTPRRNSKLSEPFSPLALNSNLPPRERNSNSRRSSTASISSIVAQQPVVSLTDIKHEVPNGYNDVIPIISEQKFSVDIPASPHRKRNLHF